MMGSGRRTRLAAEGIGTSFLLMTVVGSGIMGDRLAGGNVAVALLANSLATGFVLAVLIYVVGPVSGAHFNPAVTVAAAGYGWLPWADVVPYVVVQFIGAIAGVFVAHWMFELSAIELSAHSRNGLGQWWSEGIATFGLLSVIIGCQRRRGNGTALAVGGYIAGAYWFTASTSFANPAVTVARMLTNTFASIRPGDALGFIVAQVIGAGVAWLAWRYVAQVKS